MDAINELDDFLIEDFVFDVEIVLIGNKLREADFVGDETIEKNFVLVGIAYELVLMFFDHVVECRVAQVVLILFEDVELVEFLLLDELVDFLDPVDLGVIVLELIVGEIQLAEDELVAVL